MVKTKGAYSGRVAERLRAVRERKKKSISEVVDALAGQGYPISEKTLYAYEHGTRKVHLDLMPALAAALGVSVRSLWPRG